MSMQTLPKSSGLWDRVMTLDSKIIRFLSDNSLPILRVALAVIFIWFGVLKVIGASPVYQLVADTLPWVPPQVVVPLIGLVEIGIGIGLMTRFALRATLLFFFLQMAGTFLVLVTQPSIAFQNNNPFLLTMEGEFVIKNLILISAGLVIGATVRQQKERI